MAGAHSRWAGGRAGRGHLLGGRSAGGGALAEGLGRRAHGRAAHGLSALLPQLAEVLLGATGIMRLAPVTPVDVRKWGSVKIAWLVARRLAVTSRQRRRVSIRAPGLAPIWTGRLGAMRKRGHSKPQGAGCPWAVGRRQLGSNGSCQEPAAKQHCALPLLRCYHVGCC